MRHLRLLAIVVALLVACLPAASPGGAGRTPAAQGGAGPAGGEGTARGEPAGEAGQDDADAREQEDQQDDEAGKLLGTAGAVQIPIRIDSDCQATVALYTPQGRLVRILGQLLELRQGQYVARWDGLDMWGNLVPAGSDLVAKVITNPGLKACYEFTVSAAASPPWGTSPSGEGDAMRAGGWLADHSPPCAAVAVGDKVILGSTLAESGSSLIAVNLQGQKMWGMGLEGWAGPAQLTSDGRWVYGLLRTRTAVYRIDPQTRQKARLIETGKDPIQALCAEDAAHGQRLCLLLRDHRHDVSPLLYGLSNRVIDFAASEPQVLNTSAPTEFTISPQAAFGNTFHSPGNPQNGAGMVVRNAAGYVVLAFKEPAAIGTLVMGQMPSAAKAEVYALKEGLEYDEKKHSPTRAGEEGPLGALDAIEMDKYWRLVAEGVPDRPMNFLTPNGAGIKARAMYIRCLPRKAEKDWRPQLTMARLMRNRAERLPAPCRTLLPEGLDKDLLAGAPAGPAWNFRTKLPVSEVYPAVVVVDFQTPQTFDGVAMLNCVNPLVFVDAYTGDPSSPPAPGDEGAWEEVARYRAKYDKKLRYLSASVKGNEEMLAMPRRLTTRALRFRVVQGFRGGKWGDGTDDCARVRCDDVALLRLADAIDRPPAFIFRVAGAGDGKTLQEFRGDDLNIAAMAFSPSGTLLTLMGNRLCRTEIAPDGLKHHTLNDKDLREPVSICATADRIAVGDRKRHAVLLLDHQGNVKAVIGDRGPRRPGPWDPDVVDRPGGVAIDREGRVWVAEELFAPKRVACYGADGKFLKEYLGPPMYGGGGCLDPNLKAFYYRSMEFELDWTEGTSRLRNLNDRLTSQDTPTNENSSFTYTGVDRPIYHNGRRYIVGQGGGIVICMLDGPTWRPCATMGAADHAPFLLNKDVWKRHWARLDLAGKFFIWCDRNDDGAYQVEEVELFDKADFGGLDPFRGVTIGPDLTCWGQNARFAPVRFTDKGVPVYEFKAFQPFDYSKLAPVYTRNITLGGPRSAKPNYSGFKLITASGCLIQEGQPYVVLPDMTLRAGEAQAKPSDYLPPIGGTVMNQPWKFAGSVQAGPLGELAAVNSNNGYWYVWAADYGVVVGAFFTGRDGGWGTGLEERRGMDVTGRKQSWEGWGAHFVQGHDGKCYAVAGKGFHGISRIEGLDRYKVAEIPVRVSAESHQANARLRPVLKMKYEAAQLARSKSGRKEITAAKLAGRKVRLDGELDEWRPVKEMNPIGAKDRLYFDVTYDDRGVYLAYAGQSRLGNASEDWRYLFKTGFCFDLMVRADPRARSRDVSAGDRRIVFGKHKGKWVAVMYDYLVPGAPPGDEVEFASPVVTTKVSRVLLLGPEACTLAVREDALGVDLTGRVGADESDEPPPLPGAAAPKRDAPKGLRRWTAEVFLPWATLGVQPGAAAACDFGVLSADPDGQGVEKRSYWSNRATEHVSDLGVEAMIDPGAWGTVVFK